MMTLTRAMLYRIAHNADDRAIAGRPATFRRMVDRPSFDIRRAEVEIDGVIYLVRPSLLIRF